MNKNMCNFPVTPSAALAIGVWGCKLESNVVGVNQLVRSIAVGFSWFCVWLVSTIRVMRFQGLLLRLLIPTGIQEFLEGLGVS